MTEDELMIPGTEEEDEAMLPDGWKEGDDFFADPSTWSGNVKAPDEAPETPDEAESTEPAPESEEAPTTGETEESDDRSAEPETEEPASGQTEEPVKSPRILKLKVNHGKQDREVDINGMSDEELIERLQKAEAFDAYKDRQMKENYRRVYQDQIDAGMTEAAARMVAANECGGKSYPLTDSPESTAETDSESGEKTTERDFVSEVQQLRALYPEVKEIPDEVALAAANGTNLLAAYAVYKGKQTQQAAASLKKENEVLKHNAASAAKAPVRGVVGGGATDTKPKSDLLVGFDSDDW